MKLKNKEEMLVLAFRELPPSVAESVYRLTGRLAAEYTTKKPQRARPPEKRCIPITVKA